MNEDNDISFVIYINKRMSTNEWVLTLYVLSFLHPLLYFFCNIYAKYFIYVSILWLGPPYLLVL